MHNSRLVRPLAIVGTASILAAGAVVMSVSAASAAALPAAGYITPSPATGSNGTPLTFNMSGACTDANATNVQVKMFGTGFPAVGQLVVANSPISAYSANANGGLVVSMGQTLADIANAQTPAAVYSGAYRFVLTCRTNSSSTSLGDYVTRAFFSYATHYSVTGPAAIATTTVLTDTDGNAGNLQTLTAQVTPASGSAIATGWAEFYNGTTRLGDLVALDATGKAVLTGQNFAATAGQVLTAVYTSDDTSASTGSKSANVIYPHVVNATTTTLSVSPVSPAQAYSTVTLTATVNQAIAGTVAFTDTVGGVTSTMATVNTVIGATTATASYATSFASAGSHSFAAAFSPTNTYDYTGSSSAATPYAIAAPTAAPVTENITVSIAAGSLTLSIANTADVRLHGAASATAPADLNAAGNLLVATGTLNAITVTDTRAQDQGATHWTVSGSVVDFTDGGGHAISGNNLGWVPSVLSKATSQTVVAGSAVNPSAGLASGSGIDGTNGLQGSRTLAASATGTSTGTAQLTAGLTLNAPTNTAPNTVAHPTYNAIMTITAA